MITEAQKKRIMEAIAANRGNYPSDAKHAASLGITTSVYSAVKNGQTDKVLSDANWIGIARRLGVNLRGEMEWKAAKTATFEYITAQLEFHSSRVSRLSLWYSEHRQDVHGAILRAEPQKRCVHRLFTGKNKIEAGA